MIKNQSLKLIYKKNKKWKNIKIYKMNKFWKFT